MTEFNRRITDRPEFADRVVALETNIDHIRTSVSDLGEKLSGHISDETAEVSNITDAVSRVQVTQDVQTRTLDRMATAIEQVAVHSSRVQALEDWRGKTEVRLDETVTRVSVIYKVVAAIVVLSPAVWAMLHQLGVLK